VGPSHGHPGRRLLQLRINEIGVELDQNLALLNLIPFLGEQLNDDTSHFGRHLDLMSLDDT